MEYATNEAWPIISIRVLFCHLKISSFSFHIPTRLLLHYIIRRIVRIYVICKNDLYHTNARNKIRSKIYIFVSPTKMIKLMRKNTWPSDIFGMHLSIWASSFIFSHPLWYKLCDVKWYANRKHDRLHKSFNNVHLIKSIELIKISILKYVVSKGLYGYWRVAHNHTKTSNNMFCGKIS